MTKEQYYWVAEHFALYADDVVSYKSLNLNYQGRKGERKYNTCTAHLMGVGLLGNKEHLILVGCGQSMAIHYTRVKFPSL